MKVYVVHNILTLEMESTGVRSSRRPAISATVKSATNQLGDNQVGDTSRSTRWQHFLPFIIYF